MGTAKREMERQEMINQIAVDCLIKAGLIERCEIHEEVLVNQYAAELADANAVAATMTLGSDITLVEVVKEIEEVYEGESHDSCYECGDDDD